MVSSLQQAAPATTPTTIEVIPLTLHIGAEIRGVDLTRPLPAAQLKAVRGPGTDYHFNSIRAWRVARDGTVTFEAAT